MPRLYEPHLWTCHWSVLTGPGGARTVVWICEYPYRTMRTSPCEDCPGCNTEALPEKQPAVELPFDRSKRLH